MLESMLAELREQLEAARKARSYAEQEVEKFRLGLAKARATLGEAREAEEALARAIGELDGSRKANRKRAGRKPSGAAS